MCSMTTISHIHHYLIGDYLDILFGKKIEKKLKKKTIMDLLRDGKQDFFDRSWLLVMEGGGKVQTSPRISNSIHIGILLV